MIQVTACLSQHLGQQPWGEQPGTPPPRARPFPVRHAPPPTRGSDTGGSAGRAGDRHPGSGGLPEPRLPPRRALPARPPPRHRHRRRRGRTPAAAGPWHLPAPSSCSPSHGRGWQRRQRLTHLAPPRPRHFNLPRRPLRPRRSRRCARCQPRPVPPSRRADPPPPTVGLSRRPHLRLAPFAARGGADGGKEAGGERARAPGQRAGCSAGMLRRDPAPVGSEEPDGAEASGSRLMSSSPARPAVVRPRNLSFPSPSRSQRGAGTAMCQRFAQLCPGRNTPLRLWRATRNVSKRFPDIFFPSEVTARGTGVG